MENENLHETENAQNDSDNPMSALTAHYQSRIAELEKQVKDRDETIKMILGGRTPENQTEHNADYDNSGFMNKLRL